MVCMLQCRLVAMVSKGCFGVYSTMWSGCYGVYVAVRSGCYGFLGLLWCVCYSMVCYDYDGVLWLPWSGVVAIVTVLFLRPQLLQCDGNLYDGISIAIKAALFNTK